MRVAEDETNETLDSLVRPSEWRNPQSQGTYDFVVIGGGTAGLVSAVGAAGLGARVALVERKARPTPTHPAHDRGEIDVEAGDSNAQCFRSPKLADRTRCSQDRLRGHAAGVQAVAAQPVALDKCHARAKPGRTDRADEASRAAPNHDEVVGTLWLRVPPVRGVHETISGAVGVIAYLPHAVLHETRCAVGLPLCPHDGTGGRP